MLKRVGHYFAARTEPASASSAEIENDGYTVLPNVLSATEIDALAAELEQVYMDWPIDTDGDHMSTDEKNDFRHAALNKSALSQVAVGHPRILEVIEPLLGEDCHVIANTVWRNPARAENVQGGGGWHIDAGPHIPRSPEQAWPDHIPYPIFAIGVHIFLQDCPLACGPTGVIPGSHKSGRFPPQDRRFDLDVEFNGNTVLPLVAKAGDVAMFASDVWHRRLPSTEADSGRFFLQVHYARRDIAQRLLPTKEVNHLSNDAIERALTTRQQTLIGLHARHFYDG